LPLAENPFGVASALHLTAWGILPFPQETPVRLVTIGRRVVGLILALWLATAGADLLGPAPAVAQDQKQHQPKQDEPKQDEPKTEELSRKVKTKVLPVYPDVARRMSIAGTVRLAVVVAPNGTVKSSRPVGGHPLLVDAAMDAMKQWKFEAGPTESSGTVEFKFQP
jgi:TonB family protein